MKLRFRLLKYFLTAVILSLALFYVVKNAGPATIRLYIESGIGNCKEIPIMCSAPEDKFYQAKIDQDFVAMLHEYNLDQIHIHTPDGFKLVKQKIVIRYYKKKKDRSNGSTIYIVQKPVDFFVTLFADVTKNDVKNDYDFVSRVMNARINKINNLKDAFYVIMKGIFTPDLGDQASIKIVKVKAGTMNGFVSYNYEPHANYFDCNLLEKSGGYYKVYIKDKAKKLDLDKVVAMISTLRLNDNPVP